MLMPSDEQRGNASMLNAVGNDRYSAGQVAEAFVLTLEEMRAVLAPILGALAVAALYRHCLHLCAATHPCFESLHGKEEMAMNTSSVRAMLAQQSSADACQLSDALVNTFYTLLVSLIGPPLTGLYPEDGADSQSLIDSADAAMYRAKRGEFVGTPPPLSPNRQMVQMREANGALVIAALGAQQLQQRAEATLRQEQFILAMVAHELRTPLAPLSLSTELLAHVDQKELPRLHEIIGRQVEHLTRLVDDLVDVTRASTGKLHLTRQTIDLSVVIQQAIDVCTSAINARHQMLELKSAKIALYVDGDHLRLTQIFSNLLGNASKFTPTTGVINLSLSVIGAWAQVEVSDSGIGISAKALPIIFEPFIQDQHALGINSKGLGIGLTVVRELVEAHGGSVVAHSKGLGLGSCFIVRLPLLEPSESDIRAL
jgi:signal transduction histidine kinase